MRASNDALCCSESSWDNYGLNLLQIIGHLVKDIINSKIYIIHTSYIYTIYLILKNIYVVVNSFKCLSICLVFPWEKYVKAEQVHELTKYV